MERRILTEKEIEEFVELTNKLNFVVQYILNDDENRALILAVPSKEYNKVTDLPFIKDNKDAQKMFDFWTFGSKDDWKDFEYLCVVAAEISYEYAKNKGLCKEENNGN
jgi:hypothetical protein